MTQSPSRYDADSPRIIEVGDGHYLRREDPDGRGDRWRLIFDGEPVRWLNAFEESMVIGALAARSENSLPMPSRERMREKILADPDLPCEVGPLHDDKNSEPYGYVWFNKHMEQRFTRKLPHPQSSEQPVDAPVPVYRAIPSATQPTVIEIERAIMQRLQKEVFTGEGEDRYARGRIQEVLNNYPGGVCYQARSNSSEGGKAT